MTDTATFPGAAEPLKADRGGKDAAPAKDHAADRKTADKHDPAKDGVRPEVVSSTNTPPEDAIREYLDRRAEDSKEGPEKSETISVRKDQLTKALASQAIGAVDMDRLRADVEQLAEHERVVQKGVESAKKEAKKAKDDLRTQAELHHNYGDEVATDPLGEPIIESSAPDTAGQAESYLEGRAQPLREAAAEQVAGATENGSQHNLSSEAAENGEPWPAHPVDGTESAEDRDKTSEKAAKKLRSQALAAFDKVKGEARVVPHLREGAPASGSMPTDAAWDDESYEHLKVMSAPSNGLAVGNLVSRLDEAHEYVGVVCAIDNLNVNHPLVEVKFANEGQLVWLPPNNLKLEGNLEL